MSKKDKKKGKAKAAEEVVLAEPLTAEAVEDLVGPAGAGLCYGEPVRWGGRTVIPVARVGGSRDALAAKPVGYIEVDANGTRYMAIGGGGARDRVLAGVVAAAAGLIGALVGVAIGRRRR